MYVYNKLKNKIQIFLPLQKQSLYEGHKYRLQYLEFWIVHN